MKLLSQEQCDRYRENGILFPVAVLSESELTMYRGAFDDFECRHKSPRDTTQLGQCHLNMTWAWDLATHPRILDAVEDLIGEDILIHSSTIFYKRPRTPNFVSWHQDGYYWGLSAPRLVSAWVALADSTVENGCLRVIPGSHLVDRYPHGATAKHKHNLLGTGLEIAVEVAPEQAVDVTLRAGEMSLHHVSMVHGSEGNRSDTYRIGFAVRYLAADVSQELNLGHPAAAARGRTDASYFELAERPPERDPGEEFAAHAEFSSRHEESKRRQGQG